VAVVSSVGTLNFGQGLVASTPSAGVATVHLNINNVQSVSTGGLITLTDTTESLLITADMTITGITAPSAASGGEGRVLFLRCNASVTALLTHLNAAVSTNDRIATPDGVDFPINSRGNTILIYHSTAWRPTENSVYDRNVGAGAAIAQTKLGATTGDVVKASGSSAAMIAAGVIDNADINAAAAIAQTKLGATVGDVVKSAGSAGAYIAQDVIQPIHIGHGNFQSILIGFAYTFVGGGASYVPILTATDLPYSILICDFKFLVSTAVAAATVQLRNSTGSVNYSAAASAAALGAARDSPTVMYTVPAGGTLSLFRSSVSVAGTVIVTGIRT
jgi:hypothetical protein